MVSTKAGDRPLSGGEQVQQLKDSPLWGHLRSVLMQYLEEQPEAPMDIYDAVHQLVLKGTMTPVPPSCGTVPMHSSSPAKHLSAAEMLNQYRFSVDLRNRMKDPLWAKNYLDLVVTPVKRRAGASEDEDDEDGNGSSEISEKVEMEDVVSVQNLLSEVGSGLDRATAQHVAVALRHLAQSEPVRSVRFWGCIFATQRTYFIAETQWSEERAEEMGNNAHGDHTEQSGNDENEDESSSAGSKSTQIVQLLNRYQLRLPHPVAAEEKTGTNLYRYFVMYSDQWMQWTILPDVRPEWIRCARTVHCFFKGDLDAPVSTHPPFPGRERHYLRAQIARITHSTLVAPKHALQREDGGPEDEEEEEEGEEAPGNPNKGEKEGLPSPSTACATLLPPLKLVKPYAEVPPLVAPTTPEDDDEEAIAAVQDWYSGYANDVLMELRSWVHIAPRLLQGQARATLFTPENDNDADEEEESEDPNASDGPSSENTRRMGGVQQYLKQLQQGREERVPPILTPIAYDGVGLDTNTSTPTRGMIHARTHPWCVRKAFTSLSASSRTYAVKSTLWPGATCVARVEDGTPGVLYQNVYLGMGLKARDGSRYTPPTPTSHAMLEFPCRHDVLHSDATLEEEEVYMVLPTQETDNVMGRDHDAAGGENAEDADDA